VNEAKTVISLFKIILQIEFPVQPPDQPLNVPPIIEAVKETLVPKIKVLTQLFPQFIPDGFETTQVKNFFNFYQILFKNR
jgi:hypothetical protein